MSINTELMRKQMAMIPKMRRVIYNSDGEPLEKGELISALSGIENFMEYFMQCNDGGTLIEESTGDDMADNHPL